MNNKISLKQLSQILAEKADISNEEAESFIKNTFQCVVDEIAAGNTAEIPGIGRFSASSDIDEPVAFEPDESFTSTVNAPFSMFDSEELIEGATLEVDDEHIISIDPYKPEENPDIDESPIIVNETESTDDDSSVIEENDTVDVTVDEPECTSDSDSPAATLPEKSDEIESVEEDYECLPEEQEEYVQYTVVKSQFGLGFTVGLVSGLAVGALAFVGYMIWFV